MSGQVVTFHPDTLIFQLASSVDILDLIKLISLNAASVNPVKKEWATPGARLGAHRWQEVKGWRVNRIEAGATMPLTVALSSEGCEEIFRQTEDISGAMGQDESRTEELDLSQIQELCLLFMKECPSGALHLHEFKRIFGVQSTSVEESLYMETVFYSFDTNKVKRSVLLPSSPVVKLCLCRRLQDNTLDFLEYVAALHLLLRGNLEDRLKWSFKMYDKDGNGKLDRQEVKRLIKVRRHFAG